jgi:predicted outer membrane repeat protein
MIPPQTLSALFLATLFLSLSPLGAQTFVVTKTTDSNPAVDGELRFEIEAAGIGSAVTFDLPPASGPITLQRGVIGISKNLTIDASALSSGVEIVASANERIFNVGSAISVEMKNLTLSGGSSLAGGAVNSAGSLTLRQVTFSGNSASSGGAIYSGSSALVLEGCTFVNNTASGGNFSRGGALAVAGAGGSVAMLNCTFTGNSAPTGAAMSLESNNNNTSTMDHCTVSGNTGTASAIFIGSSGNLRVNNSIVANNAANISDISVEAGSTLVTGIGPAAGSNLIGRNDGVSAVFPTGSLVGTIAAPVLPLLGALAANGGSTRTMLPANNSPVRDAGTSSTIAVDQRGVTRPKGSAPDLGAVEIDNSARIASLNAQIAAANRAATKARADLKKAQRARNAGAINRARAAIKRAEATANLLRPQLIGL